MPSFTAVVTAHNHDPGPILRNLREQTRQPDEILLFISTTEKTYRLSHLEGVTVFLAPDRQDWGHEKRALGLKLATGDFIGWFNHDDEYEPDYIAALLSAIKDNDADVAFCNWSHGGRGLNVNNACAFAGGNSTSGNWIGRTSLIREVGYLSRDYSADAHLIDAVRPRAKVVKVDGPPKYHHNP